MLRHCGVKMASGIAFGNQTIFLPSNRTKVEDSRLCVPTSRQVCLFGAFKDQLVDPGNQGGQTELNNLNQRLSTVILKGFVPADPTYCFGRRSKSQPSCLYLLRGFRRKSPFSGLRKPMSFTEPG